jgi:hypothetical protein
MRRLKFLLLLLCFLVGWTPAAFAWPELSAETFAQHKKWRQERSNDKRGRQEREERQEERNDQRHERIDQARRQENTDHTERRPLSPEERSELRRQIRRANQDDR